MSSLGNKFLVKLIAQERWTRMVSRIHPSSKTWWFYISKNKTIQKSNNTGGWYPTHEKATFKTNLGLVGDDLEITKEWIFSDQKYSLAY